MCYHREGQQGRQQVSYGLSAYIVLDAEVAPVAIALQQCKANHYHQQAVQNAEEAIPTEE